MILNDLKSSKDIKQLSYDECNQLSKEIRETIIRTCSKQGGHLASSLGLVETTIALHRVFDTSVDRVVFDVGHQCYAHKILTGRLRDFEHLREFQGISGFPKPSESLHDAFAVGHASNSVSVALGMAHARSLQKQDYNVIAIIGDGALSGGLAYEGMVNAGSCGEKMIIIVNDNNASIGRNLKSLNNVLSLIRNSKRYLNAKEKVKERIIDYSWLYNVTHEIKNDVKNLLIPVSQIASVVGFDYLGPVNGHNIQEVERLLVEAKKSTKPVILHINTVKGKGYTFAELNPEKYHGVGPFHISNGKELKEESDCFSSVFGQTLCEFADNDPTICGISAAMVRGTGLSSFFEKFPTRSFDSGIAEEHAVSMSAGLAKQGMKPVVAIYSTFLQRSFDELMEDVALNKVHVTIGVDRSGLVGKDGETHQGIYDLAFLSQIPNSKIYLPSNYLELKSMLRQAIYDDSNLSAVRYPRGKEGNFQKDLSSSPFSFIESSSKTAVVTYGIMINNVEEALKLLDKKTATPNIYKLNCLDRDTVLSLAKALKSMDYIVFVEDVQSNSCVGEQIVAKMGELSIIPRKVKFLNAGNGFVTHGDIASLYEQLHIDPKSIAEALHG